MEPGNLESEADAGSCLGRSTLRNPVLGTLLLVIRGYRYFISPLIIPSCRFYPSCSEYATHALMRFGLFGGLRLSVKRLLKCHPFYQGGVDPVPEASKTVRCSPSHHHG